MTLTVASVEQALVVYARDEVGPKRTVSSKTRICGELGICDEDLWDMIDHVLTEFRIPRPTNQNPAHIDIHQRHLTFRMLAEWICHGDGVTTNSE